MRLKFGMRGIAAYLIDDLCQETLARVLAAMHGGKLQSDDRLGAFVWSVSEYVFREFSRQEQRTSAGELPDVADGRRSIAEDLVQQERKEIVRQMLGRLPKRERAVLRMVFYEDVPKDEICRQLGIAPKTIPVLVGRARQMLKERLRPAGPRNLMKPA